MQSREENVDGIPILKPSMARAPKRKPKLKRPLSPLYQEDRYDPKVHK